MRVVAGDIYELRDSVRKPVPNGFDTIYRDPGNWDGEHIVLPAGARLKVLGLAGPPYNEFQRDEDPDSMRAILVEYDGLAHVMREHKILSAAYKKVKP